MENHETPQKFEPTEEMRRVLLAFCNMDNKPTVTARMDAAGVERTKWYDWIRKDGFEDWWREETEKFFKNCMAELWKIGMMKSPSDHRYWQDMIMRFGGFTRNEKQEHSGNVSQEITIKHVHGDPSNPSLRPDGSS